MTWVEQAACRGVDPGLFFPGRGGDLNTPRRLCAGCPVAADCLDYALSGPWGYDGIWGGTTSRQRRQIKLGMRRAS